ncbi:proteinase-activated receptor 3-like [Brachyhypopomus gauderio]|uniref:proteinase-activated receptor 3-like n=1 Tax=Brachyhypopomus gauderio TaxID=698409 RepID=UPI004042D30B
MWRLLPVVLYAFVLFQTPHARRNKTDVPKDVLRPKTLGGGIAVISTQPNSTAVPASLNTSYQYALNYTTGILSTRIIPAMYVVAILIGVPSNVLVLTCLSRKTRSQTTVILYLSLATSNLLLLLSLTLRVHYHVNGNDWVFGELACRVATVCFYGNIYCSVHTHMCISVKRYLAVVHPFVYRGLSKHLCVTWASLTVWVVFALTMVPELLARQSYYVVNHAGIICHDVLPYKEDSHKYLIPYRLCLIFFGFMVPVVIITFSYGSIIIHLGRSSCGVRKKNYVKAITIVFGIFLVCFTPSNMIHLIHYIRLYTSQPDDFYIYYSVAACLCCLHSCMDPFLYYIVRKASTSTGDFISLINMRPKCKFVGFLPNCAVRTHTHTSDY